jgi:hypothetical protein
MNHLLPFGLVLAVVLIGATGLNAFSTSSAMDACLERHSADTCFHNLVR